MFFREMKTDDSNTYDMNETIDEQKDNLTYNKRKCSFVK